MKSAQPLRRRWEVTEGLIGSFQSMRAGVTPSLLEPVRLRNVYLGNTEQFRPYSRGTLTSVSPLPSRQEYDAS